MIIKRLTLYNFGVYAGMNTFEFEGDKPIVLIGGMNGRGKTTFLEAVLLSLYGSNSFAYTEGNYTSYGQYLKSFVNKSDGTNQTYVEMEFFMENNDVYTIHRKWNSNKKRVKEEIAVKMNGVDNPFLTDNWSMFIENILPSGLSNYFFFDGEKIAVLAEEDTDEQMKESIRTLLGIDVVDKLETDLKRISGRAEKENAEKYNVKESNKLKEAKEQAEEELEELDNKIEKLQNSLIEIEKKIEVEQINYTTKGGDIVEKKQELYEERAKLNARLHNCSEKLNDLAMSAFPLIMAKDLLKKVELCSKDERQNKENELAIRKLKELYKSYSLNKPSDEVDDFIRYVESNAKKIEVEDIYSLSDSSYYQVCTLNDSLLFELKTNTKNVLKEKKEIQEKLEEIESYLSVEIDEKSINKIYKTILKLEKKKVSIEVELDECNRKRPGLNGDVIKLTTEFNRYVEGMLSSLELNDDADRIVKYSHKIIDVMDRYKIKLQEQKVEALAETMTKCYKQLANKKTLIERISMSPETLDFYYYNANGEEVPKKRLSAGEKQLMVVALLWSLAICSRRKLPVIIDTPLSRLDSKHRIAFIKTYFPNASDQTIILSTDSEISGRYYEAIKENVGDEFTLCYDDVDKSTSIKVGYEMEGEKW